MDLSEQDWIVQFETTVKYFNDFIDALEVFRDEGQLIVEGEAVFSDVRDPSNVGMAKSKVKGKAFESFKYRGDGQTIVGVNFQEVQDFLKGTGTSNNVVVTYPVERNNSHYMHLDVIQEGLEFLVPLVDKNAVPEAPQAKPISSDTRVTIDGSSFKKAITNCMKVETEQNNSITLSTSGNTFKMASEDQVKGQVEKEFNAGGPNSDETLADKSTEISMGYLDDIKKIVGGSETVTIHVDDDYPLRVDVDIDDAGDAKIIYVIAPRIES